MTTDDKLFNLCYVWLELEIYWHLDNLLYNKNNRVYNRVQLFEPFSNRNQFFLTNQFELIVHELFLEAIWFTSLLTKSCVHAILTLHFEGHRGKILLLKRLAHSYWKTKKI